MSTYTWRRGAATVAGILCIAAETSLSITHVVMAAAQDWYLQTPVQAVIVAGIAQAIAMIVLCDAWRQRRWIVSLVSLLGLAACVAFTFSTTKDRTAVSRLERLADRDTVNQPRRMAEARVKDLEGRVKAECGKRGSECRRLETELGNERAVLAGYGDAVTVNGLGAFDQVPDYALPLMFLFLSFAFIAYAEAPAEQPVKDNGSSQTSFPVDGGPLPGKEMFEPIVDTPVDVAARAAAVTRFADEYQRRHGRRPSTRIIEQATGVSRSAVSRYNRRRAAG